MFDMRYLVLSAAEAEGGTLAMLSTFAPLVLLFLVFYLMIIRPQKKRDKKIQEMRSKVEVGDEIVTVGGVIGRVVSIREDSLVLETGSDRSKIRITRWAVQSNNTVHDNVESAK